MQIARAFSEFIRDDGGAVMVEYSLILSLVSSVTLAGFLAMSNAILNTYTREVANMQLMSGTLVGGGA